MGISREELFHVARLAHIDLTPAEAETLPAQLDRIVEHVRQLEAVPAAGAPGAGASASPGRSDASSAAFTTPQTPLRPDTPGECLAREDALAAAPARRGDLIAVPRVIGGEDEA